MKYLIPLILTLTLVNCVGQSNNIECFFDTNDLEETLVYTSSVNNILQLKENLINNQCAQSNYRTSDYAFINDKSNKSIPLRGFKCPGSIETVYGGSLIIKLSNLELTRTKRDSIVNSILKKHKENSIEKIKTSIVFIFDNGELDSIELYHFLKNLYTHVLGQLIINLEVSCEEIIDFRLEKSLLFGFDIKQIPPLPK